MEDTDQDSIKILVATDNHLGYLERDGIRGNDSFKTFEEILSLAVEHDVDFLLLAGDLYHEARPTTTCIHESLRLMRKYCMGSKPIAFEVLSDPNVVYKNTAFPISNYTDPNLNVALPIFTIHGNHDDPSGPGGTCAVDLLHASGFVNLFGKSCSVESLDLSPILLRKGSNKLAIYGLGAQREERLHRLFLKGSVSFQRPSESPDDWFSLICVHQNRAKHGPTGYLPEHFLPNFFDLVIWGHEHECLLAPPQHNAQQNFYVIQPGSSVATSLSDGEAVTKAVGLLTINRKRFATVRPMYIDDIVLEDLPGIKVTDHGVNEKVQEHLTKVIEGLISQCTRNSIISRNSSITTNFVATCPLEPLIRLRIDISNGFETFSAPRFGQMFVGRVANPKVITYGTIYL